MQPIFEFIDYRKFLASYYTGKKESFPNFSFRYFSQKIGLNSPSFLKHVIDGKRNLTSKMTDRFCKALDLSAREARYFRNLVLFNQAKTSNEKQEHYAVLRSMAGTVKEATLGTDYYDYFASWYNPVLRELICLHDFHDDFKLIAAAVSPPIRPGEAKAGIALLLRLKLVEKLLDGTYHQTSTALIADSSISSLAVRSFTRTMLDHSKTALDTVDKGERHISGLTMGISTAAYNVLTAEIESFKDRVKIIVNRDSGGSRIYQLNIGMFPVSQDVGAVIAEKDGGKE
jgi:uncharacterized protein (TIGR02147 family)